MQVLGDRRRNRRRQKFNVGDVTVIVPTRNEEANVRALLSRIEGLDDERVTGVLFVDDSDDDTPIVVRDVGAKSPLNVSIVHRPRGERLGGLGGAVLEGFKAAQTPWVCIMDGDLQHPPELIPQMIDQAIEDRAAMVVGTRYSKEGSIGEFGGWRTAISKSFTFAARTAFPRRVGKVSDPMSGFFLVRLDQLDLNGLHPDGYKILLEILVRTPDITTAEVGFEFGERHAGDSKASLREGLRFLRQLAKSRITAPSRGREFFAYDIHGIVSVEASSQLPELKKFRVERVLNPDIRVHVGNTRLNGQKDAVAYREIFGRWGFAARISRGSITDISVSRLVAFSPHVLYTNVVEPVLRWTLAERGFALVHAACVEKDGLAFMVTARTDTGKTTTMLKILGNGGGFGFISDDLTLVNPEGDVLTYPKPLTISHHTLHATPKNHLSFGRRFALVFQSRLHSKSGRKTGFVLARSGLPAATMNAVVQKLIPPPKYFVETLIPEVHLSQKAKLAGLFIIERGGTGSESLPHKEAMTTLLENCEDAYGFPPYQAIAPFLQQSNGNNLIERERKIIADAFEGAPATVHRSETLDWAERLPRFIEEATRYNAQQSEADEPEIIIDHNVLERDEEPIQSVRETG